MKFNLTFQSEFPVLPSSFTKIYLYIHKIHSNKYLFLKRKKCKHLHIATLHILCHLINMNFICRLKCICVETPFYVTNRVMNLVVLKIHIL